MRVPARKWEIGEKKLVIGQRDGDPTFTLRLVLKDETGSVIEVMLDLDTLSDFGYHLRLATDNMRRYKRGLPTVIW